MHEKATPLQMRTAAKLLYVPMNDRYPEDDLSKKDGKLPNHWPIRDDRAYEYQQAHEQDQMPTPIHITIVRQMSSDTNRPYRVTTHDQDNPIL